MTVVTALVLTARDASAYRPFDGTDADVADPGAFELELCPAQYFARGGAHYLYAPVTVLNLGLVPRLELVFDFKGSMGLDTVPGEDRTAHHRYGASHAGMQGRFVIRCTMQLHLLPTLGEWSARSSLPRMMRRRVGKAGEQPADVDVGEIVVRPTAQSSSTY